MGTIVKLNSAGGGGGVGRSARDVNNDIEKYLNELYSLIETLGSNKVTNETNYKTVIVAGATAVPVIAANANRKTLVIINDGAGDAYYGFSNAVTASDGGMPLVGNGGGNTWAINEAPTSAIYVFSTAGSTIRVKEGV